MLTQKHIGQYFDEINEALKATNTHGEIIIAGGASMTMVYDARDATKDIDAIFEPREEFREIIDALAVEHGVEKDWLNDGVKGFFTPQMQTELYKQLSNLTVKSVDVEGLLAMKLTAARHGGHDLEDCLTLMNYTGIERVEQLYEIIEKYAHPNYHTPKSRFFSQQVFEQYSDPNRLGPLEAEMKRLGHTIHLGME